MKKILCLFGALTLLLNSCSSDDSSSDSSDLVLLKKTIITDSDGEKVTTIYKYDGNKIVSAVDDSGDTGLYYTYTGDLITKIEFKYPDGTIDQINTFSYNAEGKLTTFVRVEPNIDWGHKEVYTYNTDGTILVKSYSGDSKTQTGGGVTSTIKFVDGEVSEIVAITANQPDHKYTYDNKNNPAKNILGMDKIAFADGEGSGVKFNILTDTADGDLWTKSTFTYNDQGYPTKEVDKGSESLGTIEYFY
ncbi:hypothetical protein ACQ9BO_08045 [Flavobacterium sp. P21]|uniref:hypothetical protein n=1 Tax=Flavobacterium sp. P21 TaxID=3423948 RepID=UPI003D67A901